MLQLNSVQQSKWTGCSRQNYKIDRGVYHKMDRSKQREYAYIQGKKQSKKILTESKLFAKELADRWAGKSREKSLSALGEVLSVLPDALVTEVLQYALIVKKYKGKGA